MSNQDRRTTIDDERKRMLDLYDMRLVPPDVGIFDEPTRCYLINKEWAAIVMGMVSWLTEIAPWYLAENEDYEGIQAVAKFLEGHNCGDDICTIEVLLEDDEFFNEQYVPATFGDWHTNTTQHNEDLNDAYDGTPQSIGAEIPTGAPNDRESFALCYALNSFVSLYASAKVCILQSRNFLQIAWDEVREAVNAVYNLTQQSLAFIYTPDLYSCFVDDETAITVLQDTAAIEELACFLLDELMTVTMSQANFDDAISAAATTLVGNAQLIACILENDNNLSVYLNFLEAYNIALLRISNGELLECPCLVGTYRVWEHDFRISGLGEFEIEDFAGGEWGVLESNGVRGWPNGSNKQAIVKMPLDPTHRIRSIGVQVLRVNGLGNPTHDAVVVTWRQNINTDTGAINPTLTGGLGNGTVLNCGEITLAPGYSTDRRQLFILARGAVVDITSNIYIQKVIIHYMDGFAPGGYVTDDSNPC